MVFGGVEFEKELEDLIMHCEGIRVGTVNLVNHDDGLQAFLESLAQHETSLGLWPAEGIDDEDDTVHHFHDTFHFSAEVGVSRGVYDVNDVLIPVNGSVLGLNGDAFFTFQIHGVHGALGDGLVFTVGAASLKKLIDEGRFAMVNVGDDGEVSELGHDAVGWLVRKRVRSLP